MDVSTSGHHLSSTAILVNGDAIDENAGATPAAALPRRRGANEDGRSWLKTYPATHLLVAVNVLIFAVMLVAGPLPSLRHTHEWAKLLTFSFSPEYLVRWGAVDSDLILQHGQWWRLLTSTFVHVNVLHLLLNVWCLWNLGFFGESLLGRRGLCIVYMLTGLSGMLASVG